MRGFAAMCLLQSFRCVFLALWCAALRRPWMSALELPVVRVPPCARGLPGVLFTTHLHMYNKSVLQYCRYIKKRRLSLSLSYIQNTAGPKAFLMSRLSLLEYS